MTEIPGLPNWLAWLLALITIGGAIWTIGRFFWKRWLYDLIAKRNQNSSKNRAKVLIKELDYAWGVINDDRQFHAQSLMTLSNQCLSIFCIICGFGIFDMSTFLHTPEINNIGYLFTITPALLLVSFGLWLFGKAIETRQRYINPFLNWQEYFESMESRIDALLIKGGLVEEAQKRDFVDGIVDLTYDELTNTGFNTTSDREAPNG